MQNATKTQTNKNAKTLVSNATKKPLLEKQGNEIYVNEVTTGEKLKKERKKNQVTEARKQAVNDYLDATMSLSQVLKNIKQYNKEYLKVIELQYGVKISSEMLNDVIPSNFVNLQTDKQKENQEKNLNRWSFRKVLQLIAKYYKNEHDKIKIVEKVAKLNLA